jgi:hypothetical protein
MQFPISIKRLFPLFLIIILSCNNQVNEKDDIVMPNPQSVNTDSILVDSIEKTTDKESFIFLNYPSFISKNIYEKINSNNIKTGKLNKEGQFKASFGSSELHFELNPVFLYNKLVSIGLSDGDYFSLLREKNRHKMLMNKKTYNEIIKNLNQKYNSSFQPKTNQLYFNRSYFKVGELSFTTIGSDYYEYSNKDKIVILEGTIYSVEGGIVTKEEGVEKDGYGISLRYFTAKSFDYYEKNKDNDEKRQMEKEKIKTKQTMEDM